VFPGSTPTTIVPMVIWPALSRENDDTIERLAVQWRR
jgi:hypothetical protein